MAVVDLHVCMARHIMHYDGAGTWVSYLEKYAAKC
jgi:hypothetical protein